MTDHLSKRVEIDARQPDLRESALATRAASDLEAWFCGTERELDARSAAMAPAEVRDLVGQAHRILGRQEARFAGLLSIGSALGSTFHIDELLGVIVEKTTELMDAERTTLFLLDEATGELWSKIVQGVKDVEIRLPLGQGIAGWVGRTGRSVSIRDPYGDPRFNPEVDAATGFQTRNILCQPIRNVQGDIVGVIQVLNRVAGDFSEVDEYLLSAIASQAAIAIENSKLYTAAIAQNMELIEIKDRLEQKLAELDMLYELERAASSAPSLSELAHGVLNKATELVHAELASLTINDSSGAFTIRNRGEWSDEWEFSCELGPIEGGIAAWSALRARALVWRAGDPIEPSARAALARSGEARALEVRNVICVPLCDGEETIGAVAFYNIVEDSGREDAFGQDERKVITLVASRLAAAMREHERRAEEHKRERLASIGQMLSGVLHDFKNPMAIISGYVQLMARAENAETRQNYAKSILTQFDTLGDMTRELLSFARGDRAILLQKIFVHELVEELIELLRPEIEGRGVSLGVEVGYRGEARLDAVKIKRAILNLARNAAEAIGEGGGALRVSVDRRGADLVFRVADDGPGIPESIRATLFDSFVTEGKENGTGLGLAIVRQIARDHDGEVDFETELGAGTTFELRVPLRAKEAP